MNRIIYFDVCALLLQGIIIFSLYFRKMTSGKINKLFISFMWLIFIDTLCDFLSCAPVNLIGSLARSPHFLYFISSLYFLCRIITPLLYTAFIGNAVGNWYVFRKHKVLWGLYIFPYAIVPVVIILNTFKKFIFYYDEQCNYHRGKWIFILYLVAVYYVIFGVIYLFKVANMLPIDKFIAMFSLFPLNACATIIQLLRPELLVEMFAMTITSLLVTMFILRAEETIDMNSSTSSYTAFSQSLKRYTDSNVPVSIIFIKIKNSTSLLSFLGNDTYKALLQAFSDRIRPASDQTTDILSIVNVFDYSEQLFYITNGTYAILFEGNYTEETLINERNRVFSAANRNININFIDIPLDICVCSVNIPKELSTYEEVMDFSATFDKYIVGSGSFALSELPEEKQQMIKENIDTIISEALIHDQFEMYFQPIYDIKEKKFTCCEALIRLHSNGHFIPPSIFIPAAEKSGAIYNIGDFVFDNTFKMFKEYNFRDIGIKYVEINMSTIQCMKDNLKDSLQELLYKYNIPTDYINFEITETATDYIQDIVTKNIEEVHRLGFEITLDDYGTGYSNLRRLTSFPFNIIKLDKSFVDDLNKPKMKAVMKNTINMIKDLGDKVVVEGVEDKTTADWFINNKCDFIQGFYYAKPMPVNEFVEFIKSKNFKD